MALKLDWIITSLGRSPMVGVTLLAPIHEGIVTIHDDGTPGFADYLLEYNMPAAQLFLAFHPSAPAVTYSCSTGRDLV